MCDVKVIPNEECVTQHKLLVCDARIVKSEDWCKKFVSKRRVWKLLQQADLCDKFVKLVGEMSDTSSEQVGNIWSRLKQDLLSATEKTCWWTREMNTKEAYGENKRGGGMKQSVRIYLRREDCGTCGRRVGAKINI